MANAQTRIMEKVPGFILNLENEIYQVLKIKRGNWLSSNEILKHLSIVTQNQLSKFAHSYTKGACRKEGSYVGSIASSMAKNGLVYHGNKYCSVLNRKEDAFRVDGRIDV